MSNIFTSVLPGTEDYEILECIMNRIGESNWLEFSIQRKSTDFYRNEHGIYTLNNLEFNGISSVPHKYFLIFYARNNLSTGHEKILCCIFLGKCNIPLYKR